MSATDHSPACPRLRIVYRSAGLLREGAGDPRTARWVIHRSGYSEERSFRIVQRRPADAARSLRSSPMAGHKSEGRAHQPERDPAALLAQAREQIQALLAVLAELDAQVNGNGAARARVEVPDRIRRAISTRKRVFIRRLCDLDHPGYGTIARRMGVKPCTVNSWRDDLFKLFGVHNRQGLYAAVRQWGLDQEGA